MDKEKLEKRDYILAIDRSGSMAEPVKKGSSQTRWQAAEELTVALAGWATQYDNDGISVTLFSGGQKEFPNVTGAVDLVKKIFTENGPNGGTNTAGVLRSIFKPYFAAKKNNAAEAKPLIVYIVTDGIPDSESDVVAAITEAVNQIDNEEEIRLNFIQIGDNEHAHKWLQTLDTGLGLKYDIVNCKTMEDLENHASLAEAAMSMVNDEAEVTK